MILIKKVFLRFMALFGGSIRKQLLNTGNIFMTIACILGYVPGLRPPMRFG